MKNCHFCLNKNGRFDYTLHYRFGPAYWEPDSGSAEVDFVAQLGGDIIPFEVKAGVNLRARSLASYRARFEPPYAVRTSLAAYEFNEGLYNIPLYAISSYLPSIIH